MRIIIIGCGRMGAGLAQNLSRRGHEVTVVDRDPTSFERLGPSFRGATVSGGGIDRNALLNAGIERADGLAAVTWGINRIIELLCYSRMETVLSPGNGDVDIVETEIPHLLVGRTVNELTVTGEIHVVTISRRGKTFLPTLGTEFHEGDLVHLALLAASADRLKALLGWL
jgi:trk system potassium uptake protein TrkA